MGAFSDLVGSKNKSVSGGSVALSASDLGGVGDTSIYKEKTKTGRESGRKKHGRKKGGAGSDRSAVVSGGSNVVHVSDCPLTIDEVKNNVLQWLGEWCAARGVDDIKKVSPLVFRDCCRYIGMKYIKPSKMLRSKEIIKGAGRGGVGSSCGAYNPAMISALYDVFIMVCDICDKIPFKTSFAAFAGVSMDYLIDHDERLTSFGFGLAKKARNYEFDAIRQKTSADSIGRLAILNNEYYSGGGGASGGSDVVAASLPASGSFGLIECGKID